MATYRCRKCGAEGTSKNISTRSFFPRNQLASMLSHQLKIDTAPEELNCRTWTDDNKFQRGGYMLITFSDNDNYNEMSLRERREFIGNEFVKFIETCMNEEYAETCKNVFGASKLDSIREWACEHDYEIVAGEELDT